MNLSNLEKNNEKDISLKQKKAKRININSKKNNNINLNRNKKRDNSSFSKNQKKKINSGNKMNILKIKRQYPERFKCSSCSFSDSHDNPNWCFLHKDVIINEYQQAYTCDNISV